MNEKARHEGKWMLSVSALICIGLGVVLVKYPGDVMQIVCKAFGVVTLLFGVIRLVIYLRKRNNGFDSIMDITIGVIMTAVGVFLLLSPETVISIIPFLVGLILLFHSITKLQQALELRDAGFESWWSMAVVALIMLAMAAFIVLKPMSTAELMVKVVGIMLIADGVMSFGGTVFTGITVKRLQRREKKRAGRREREYTYDEEYPRADRRGYEPEDTEIEVYDRSGRRIR